MKFWVFLLLVPSVLACVVPEDGMVVNSSVSFCSGVFFLDRGVSISGSGLSVDCNGVVLKGWSGGSGISIVDSSFVNVTNCMIVGYDFGFVVENSSNIFLFDNHLVRNKVGSSFVNVSGSAVLYQDVSLVSTFSVINSTDNIFSLSNKPVSGGFCGVNFCNLNRDSIFLFVSPRSDFELWFANQVSSVEFLRRSLWSDLTGQ